MVQHISIRVPWTDNGFIGRTCDCPLKNYACHRLKSIASNSSLLCQRPNMENVSLDKLDDTDKRADLPCITEGRAFMSDTETTLECSHLYARFKYESHRDFVPSIQHIPPYTLIAHPYRWLIRGKDKNRINVRDLNGIADIDDQIMNLLKHHKDGREYVVGQNWIQNHKTQEQIFTKFFENVVPNASLCFIYAKSVPYIEDSDRILLGIAVVDKTVELPQKHAKKNDAASPLESYAWECLVQHKIRKEGDCFLSDSNGVFGGFLLPYAQVIEKIESAQNNKDREEYIKQLQSIVVSVPDDFREDFSYASEHVSHDAAISTLLQTKKSLVKVTDLKYLKGNWIDCLSWINKEIDALWQDRPVYPGLGIMLSVALDKVPGLPIAKELYDYTKDKQNIDLFKVLAEWISNKQTPSGIEFTRNHQSRWNIVIENLEAFKRLARTSISFDQAECLWNKIVSGTVDITNNPYVIYTSSIYEEDNKKVSLYCVDLAFFVPKQYRDKFFGASKDCVDSANDPYRVAGFATYVLSNACAEGHTYLPIDKLLERIADINVQEACITDVATLKMYDHEFFKSLISVIENENGRFYKLVYFDKLDRKIRQLVDERIMLPDLTFEKDKFNIDLPGGTKSNVKAVQEQTAAAESIAKSAISVLCGSAGTGKTTLLTILCKSFTNKVLLLAPTGKARVRMQQNIAKNVVCDTNTIAGYLVRLESIESGKTCYDYNTGRYLLPAALDPNVADLDVIIDESSMLTEEMFGALLMALQKARRVIFVGDVSQLPPIGAGKPFYELVNKLKQMNHGFAELKTQVRFSDDANLDVELSKHFALSEDVRSQAKDEVFKLLDETPSNERLSFVEWENPEDLRVKLAEVLKQELNMSSVDDIYKFNESLGATEWNGQQQFKSGNERPIRRGIGDFADKWQIIAPLRNRFDVGTVGINAFIHEKYRSEMLKAEIEKKQHAWRAYPLPLPGDLIAGDKVINLVNTAKQPANKPLDMQRHIPIPVANGEIGIIGQDWVAYDKKWVYGVEFSSQPMRCFPYEEKDFGLDSNPILELAYAITVHKSQGSDFNTVILIMGEYMPLASREMLYTALTRQKDRLVILYNGNIASLKDLKMDSKSSLLTRYSDLFEPTKNINFDAIDEVDRSKYIHVTDNGDRVISKSEVIVANTLARHGIKYSYEKLLKLDGRDRPIKPDFTIEYNGKTYYWEHLGMLFQENYRNKWMLKLELYRKNGIEPITSKDDANGGIDSREIERIIQEKILNV